MNRLLNFLLERQDRLLRTIPHMPAVERRSLGARQVLQNKFLRLLLPDLFGKPLEAVLLAQQIELLLGQDCGAYLR